MSDTTIVWDVDNSRGDWQLIGPALSTGGDLASAVLISLFTDRQARTDDEIPDGTTDPRGWWGDADSDYPIGSRLWLLSREKQTQQTLQRAIDYSAEALQWLIDDKVVARFEIGAQWVREGFLGLQIVAYKPDGSNVAMAYAWAWNGVQ